MGLVDRVVKPEAAAAEPRSSPRSSRRRRRSRSAGEARHRCGPTGPRERAPARGRGVRRDVRDRGSRRRDGGVPRKASGGSAAEGTHAAYPRGFPKALVPGRWPRRNVDDGGTMKKREWLQKSYPDEGTPGPVFDGLRHGDRADLHAGRPRRPAERHRRARASTRTRAASTRRCTAASLWTMRQFAGFGTAEDTNAALQVPAGAGPDRALDRLRYADADGLRRRPSARARRGRPRRRRGLDARATWSASSTASRSTRSRRR